MASHSWHKPWDCSNWDRPLTPSGRLRPGQRSPNAGSSPTRAPRTEAQIAPGDAFITSVNMAQVTVRRSADLTLAINGSRPNHADIEDFLQQQQPGATNEGHSYSPAQQQRRHPREIFTTTQYIGLSRGELGVLSKREVGDLPSHGVPARVCREHAHACRMALSSNSPMLTIRWPQPIQVIPARPRTSPPAGARASSASPRPAARGISSRALGSAAASSPSQGEPAQGPQPQPGDVGLLSMADDATGAVKVPTNLFSSQPLKSRAQLIRQHNYGSAVLARQAALCSG